MAELNPTGNMALQPHGGSVLVVYISVLRKGLRAVGLICAAQFKYRCVHAGVFSLWTLYEHSPFSMSLKGLLK